MEMKGIEGKKIMELKEVILIIEVFVYKFI